MRSLRGMNRRRNGSKSELHAAHGEVLALDELVLGPQFHLPVATVVFDGLHNMPPHVGDGVVASRDQVIDLFGILHPSMGFELLSNEAARSFLGEGVAAEDGVLGSEEIAVDSEGTLRTLHFVL